MEDLIERLTNDRVSAVKIVLTAVVVVLAFYQAFLMTVGYGKVKLPFLRPGAASLAHRVVGDTIVPIALVVGVMCLGYFGLEDGFEDAALHGVLGIALFAVLAFKIAIVRWWHSLGRLLPVLGVSVLVLFVLTWITTAGDLS